MSNAENNIAMFNAETNIAMFNAETNPAMSNAETNIAMSNVSLSGVRRQVFAVVSELSPLSDECNRLIVRYLNIQSNNGQVCQWCCETNYGTLFGHSDMNDFELPETIDAFQEQCNNFHFPFHMYHSLIISKHQKIQFRFQFFE